MSGEMAEKELRISHFHPQMRINQQIRATKEGCTIKRQRKTKAQRGMKVIKNAEGEQTKKRTTRTMEEGKRDRPC
jgi:hypothetical protein